jgi:hypothetical protein
VLGFQFEPNFLHCGAVEEDAIKYQSARKRTSNTTKHFKVKTATKHNSSIETPYQHQLYELYIVY